MTGTTALTSHDFCNLLHVKENEEPDRVKPVFIKILTPGSLYVHQIFSPTCTGKRSVNN